MLYSSSKCEYQSDHDKNLNCKTYHINLKKTDLFFIILHIYENKLLTTNKILQKECFKYDITILSGFSRDMSVKYINLSVIQI